MLTWGAPKLDFRVPGQPRGGPTGSTWSRMAASRTHCTALRSTILGVCSVQCGARPRVPALGAGALQSLDVKGSDAHGKYTHTCSQCSSCLTQLPLSINPRRPLSLRILLEGFSCVCASVCLVLSTSSLLLQGHQRRLLVRQRFEPRR